MKIIHTPFVLIGNNVALDFINTEIVIRGQLTDLLQECDDLVSWAKSVDLALGPEIKPSELAQAKELRKALKDACLATINNAVAPQNTLAAINRYLVSYANPLVLSFSDKEYILKPKQRTLTVSMLLSLLAYQSATLLASTQAKKLKRCGNSDCVLLFLDTSRNQQRRWCSMETCGNRAKASNHYRKSLP